MRESIVDKKNRFVAHWKGMTDAERVRFLFLAVMLTAIALFVPVSLGIFFYNLTIPVEELDTGKSLANSIPFLKYWSLFFYRNSVFFQDRDDVFMDWFNINYMVYNNSPYIGGDSSYPPLVLNIAKIFAAMADYDFGAGEARNSPEGIASILTFYAVSLIPTFALLWVACRRKQMKNGQIALLCLAFLGSVPFLFEFDRGNYLLIALPFIFAFFLWYNSERRWAREAAYIGLSVAVGIKIYPAAFALILLKERRFAAFVRTACYSVLMLIVPFLFFEGGLDNISAFLYWLTDFAGSKGGEVNTVVYGVSYSYSPYNLPASIVAMLGPGVVDMDVLANAKAVELCGKILTVLFIVLVFFTGFASDRKWKVILSSALATMFVPSISFVYSATMCVIPIVFFLLDEEKCRLDYAYLALFLIAFVPCLSPYLADYNTVAFRWGVNLANFVQLLSYIAMLFLLTGDCVARLVRQGGKGFFRIKKGQNC